MVGIVPSFLQQVSGTMNLSKDSPPTQRDLVLAVQSPNNSPKEASEGRDWGVV